jgi:hypothetical protein
MHKMLLNTLIYFPQFIFQHYGKLNTFNKAPFKYTSAYLCEILYLYSHAVRLIWVAHVWHQTAATYYGTRAEKDWIIWLKSHDTEKDQPLLCQSLTSGASQKWSGNCSTFQLRTCTVFISLHIQAFLGSRIIQNAADCLAEHSDSLP